MVIKTCAAINAPQLFVSTLTHRKCMGLKPCRPKCHLPEAAADCLRSLWLLLCSHFPSMCGQRHAHKRSLLLFRDKRAAGSQADLFGNPGSVFRQNLSKPGCPGGRVCRWHVFPFMCQTVFTPRKNLIYVICPSQQVQDRNKRPFP